MTREEVKLAGMTHDHMMVNQQDVLNTKLNGHHLNNHQSELRYVSNTIKNAPTVTNNGTKPCLNKKQLNQQQLSPDHHQSVSSLAKIAILRRHPMYDSLVLVKRYRTCLEGYTLEFPTTDLTPPPSSQLTQNMRQQHQDASNQQQQDCCRTKLVSVYLDGDDPIYQGQQERQNSNGLMSPEGEIVYVPMNGLLERLDTYDRHGISIDSRVYAFAMGINAAEKFLTTKSMKEVQETPPL